LEHLGPALAVPEELGAHPPQGIAALHGVPSVSIVIDPDTMRGLGDHERPAGMDGASFREGATIWLGSVAVGIEDTRVFVDVAVELIGKSAQAVSWLDRVQEVVGPHV